MKGIAMKDVVVNGRSVEVPDAPTPEIIAEIAGISPDRRLVRRGNYPLTPGQPYSVEEEGYGFTDSPKFSIVLPPGMYAAIQDSLFRDPSLEQMGVILAGVSITENEVKLLGQEFIPVEEHEFYKFQYGRDRITARIEYSEKLRPGCAADELSQIDVYARPFGSDQNLQFFHTDDFTEIFMAKYIYKRLPSRGLYASIVMNHDYTKARISMNEAERNSCENIKIVIFFAVDIDLANGLFRGQDAEDEM